MATLGTGSHVPAPLYLGLLVLLNALPLYGVLALDWQAFDLILLYWLENWIIGGFMLLKILARPLKNPAEIGLVLFLGPFFAFHYGMFCTVHGVFVFALFGDDVVFNDSDVFRAMTSLLFDRQLVFGVLALAVWQFIDWLRDLIEMGVGNEGLQELTKGPYQRIFVLHFTILLSGFALIAMEEPTAGLVLLVVIKTAFDFINWRREEQKVDSVVDLEDAVIFDFDGEFKTPQLHIRNRDVTFGSFAELLESKDYQWYLALHRLRRGHKSARQLEEYMQYRAALDQKEREK